MIFLSSKSDEIYLGYSLFSAKRHPLLVPFIRFQIVTFERHSTSLFKLMSTSNLMNTRDKVKLLYLIWVSCNITLNCQTQSHFKICWSKSQSTLSIKIPLFFSFFFFNHFNQWAVNFLKVGLVLSSQRYFGLRFRSFEQWSEYAKYFQASEFALAFSLMEKMATWCNITLIACLNVFAWLDGVDLGTVLIFCSTNGERTKFPTLLRSMEIFIYKI